jgi:hypothetical protein
MRQRNRYPHRATLTRRQQTGTNELGEPLYDSVEVAADIPCSFFDESTSFVHEDSGERVQIPAKLKLKHVADVKEGDTVSVAGADTPDTELEVRGVDRRRDDFRARIQAIVVEVERA